MHGQLCFQNLEYCSPVWKPNIDKLVEAAHEILVNIRGSVCRRYEYYL